MKSIINGGAIGKKVLGVLGTRAESNFQLVGGFENRGGALAGNQIEGGATSAKHGVGPTFGTNGF